MPTFRNPHQYRVIVSAQNNPYMAWQCKLFHFSCVTRLHRNPIFFVHESGAEALHTGFEEILRAGGLVHRVPSYELSGAGDPYLPRNTPGTLLHAAAACDANNEFFLLCDPDLIFLRAPTLPETISGDYCSYINFDHDFVEKAQRVLGLARESIDEQKEELRCGTPYVIPFADARRLALSWLEAIDAFPARRWEDVMYAFGLAAVKLELKVTLTHFTESNYWPDAVPQADVIHYCYGDDRWSKRHYYTDDQARGVWEPKVEVTRKTILGEILSQIMSAKGFYLNVPSETDSAS